MKLHRLIIILCISWQVALPQSNPPTPQPVDLASVETTAIQSMMTVTTTISNVFKTYFDPTTLVYPSLLSWMGSLNNWALKSPAELSAPVNVSSTLQLQASQNINFSAGVKPTALPTMNALTQKVLLGVLYPVASSVSSTRSDYKSELVFTPLQESNLNRGYYCDGDDWVNRFSADDYAQICDDGAKSKVNTIFDAISGKKNDLDYLRRLTFYFTQAKNCLDSITALKNSSGSSGSSSMGGQTMPDPSSLGSGGSIPYVQCWFSFGNQTDELANNINADLQQSCNSLSGDLYTDCNDLKNSFKDYASQASTALQHVQYLPDQDNTVNALYAPIVQSMLNELERSLKDAQEAVYNEIFNNPGIINETPLMESIFPSMDNLILPTQYGNQQCNPLNADQDTSFDYFYLDDATSLDYAYSFIASLDSSVATGLSKSQTVGLAPLSDSTSNAAPIYIHGGRYLYCNNASDETQVYKNLCQDAKDNVYTTNLATQRSGLYGVISTTRQALGEEATLYLANRSAALSNLLNMYNKRALVGNKSRCTPAQLAEYHATWRYQKVDSNTPSWQEKVRTDNTLTQMDLMREAVLLLQDINYQLHQLNQTTERAMSIDSITSLSQLGNITQQMGTLNSTLTGSVQSYDTGHSDQTSGTG